MERLKRDYSDAEEVKDAGEISNQKAQMSNIVESGFSGLLFV
ncbi:MAG: hypothetical protein Q8P30_03920 [Candidatus Uhrbacteria bacterium]|nr:hypothetical protein [Candidatus Uhrbacteria bacterium]